jgi:AcrR family transcriptional regulator
VYGTVLVDVAAANGVAHRFGVHDAAENCAMTREMSITELVRRTGVPAATVHHYLRSGLLPSPRRVARNRFLYNESHVHALRLIRALRERRRLGLQEIRRVLPDLLGLSSEDAFRPELWDEAVGLHLRISRRGNATSRLLAAGRRTFVRHGFADVRVDDLCSAAKIAKGSFYRYYRSKEELYFAVCRATTDDLVGGFERAAAGRRLSDEEALELLSTLLQPVLALYLDLVARAFQRRPGYARAARSAFSDLEAVVNGHLRRGARTTDHRGARIVESAATRVAGGVLRLGAAATALDPHEP